jgi:hypothetical protein
MTAAAAVREADVCDTPVLAVCLISDERQHGILEFVAAASPLLGFSSCRFDPRQTLLDRFRAIADGCIDAGRVANIAFIFAIAGVTTPVSSPDLITSLSLLPYF